MGKLNQPIKPDYSIRISVSLMFAVNKAQYPLQPFDNKVIHAVAPPSSHASIQAVYPSRPTKLFIPRSESTKFYL
jgi:hypothetical protein